MFIYSLPIFFTDIAVLNSIEFLLIVLTLCVFLWVSSPIPAFSPAETSRQFGMRQYLIEAWLGLRPLWTVFWPFFLLLNLVLYYVDNLAKSSEFTVSSWDDVYFILFTPIMFWTICVWRNSGNCKARIWAGMARLMTLAVYFEYGLKLVIRIDYPRIFFNCQDLLLDYGTCF